MISTAPGQRIVCLWMSKFLCLCMSLWLCMHHRKGVSQDQCEATKGSRTAPVLVWCIALMQSCYHNSAVLAVQDNEPPGQLPVLTLLLGLHLLLTSYWLVSDWHYY